MLVKSKVEMWGECAVCRSIWKLFSRRPQKRCSQSCWLRQRQGSQQGPRAVDTLMMGTNHTPTQSTNTDTHTHTKVLKPPLCPSPSLLRQTRGPSECHTHMPYTMSSPSLPDSVWLCARKHRSPLASQAHNKSSSWQHNSLGDPGPEPWAVQHGDLAIAWCLPAPFSYGLLAVP